MGGRRWQTGTPAAKKSWALLQEFLSFPQNRRHIRAKFRESQSFWPMPGVEIRNAEDADLDGLGALEAQSFASDRLARRSLGRLLGRSSASFRVAAAKRGGPIHGYSLVLFRKGSSVARLYSIAVHGERRGQGLGLRLLADAEGVAARRKQRVLRLEVREDNLPAIRLYERLGYRRIGRHARYYADGADALRYEKPLAGVAPAAVEDRHPPGGRSPRPRRQRGA